MASPGDHDCVLVAVVDEQQRKLEVLVALADRQQRELEEIKKAVSARKPNRTRAKKQNFTATGFAHVGELSARSSAGADESS